MGGTLVINAHDHGENKLNKGGKRMEVDETFSTLETVALLAKLSRKNELTDREHRIIARLIEAIAEDRLGDDE